MYIILLFVCFVSPIEIISSDFFHMCDNISIPLPTNFTNDRIVVKSDNHISGNIFLDQYVWEIFPHRIFGRLNNGMVNVYFKPVNKHITKSYEFLLGGERLYMYNYIANWPLRRTSRITIEKIGQDFKCGVNNALWYVRWQDKMIRMHTNKNILSAEKVKRFTEMYCESLVSCAASDILHVDGRIEELTWLSDFDQTCQ